MFVGLPGERHLNPLGGVHGGWAATIMDSALGCAVQTTLQKGEAYTTAEFKVNLTRPIMPRTWARSCAKAASSTRAARSRSRKPG